MHPFQPLFRLLAVTKVSVRRCAGHPPQMPDFLRGVTEVIVRRMRLLYADVVSHSRLNARRFQRGERMTIASTTTVREIAAQLPGTTRELEKLGIDYCCGG